MELKVTPWTDENQPTEETIRELLDQQDMKAYSWSDEPEKVHAGHTHGYHKIVYVLAGSIRFDFPVHHQTFTLTLGDRLDLPTGIRHSAIVGLEGATCLEAHIY